MFLCKFSAKHKTTQKRLAVSFQDIPCANCRKFLRTTSISSNSYDEVQHTTWKDHIYGKQIQCSLKCAVAKAAFIRESVEKENIREQRGALGKERWCSHPQPPLLLLLWCSNDQIDWNEIICNGLVSRNFWECSEWKWRFWKARSFQWNARRKLEQNFSTF